MKDHQFIEVLTNLGLSLHEAGVYFASLSLGPATILKISEAAEIKRTTVYSVAQSLQQKGLMRIELKGLKKLYAAENPEKVLGIIEQRKDRFSNLLPEFTALYNLKGGESFIKYYQGLNAIKSVYEGLLQEIKPHEDYMVISDQDQWDKLDEKYFQNFTERRAKLPINIRVLLTDSTAARQYKKFEKNYNLKVKLLPPLTKLATNLVIIPRRVVINQLIPPVIAIVIENKSVIQMHRESFEIIWNAIPN